MEFLIVIATLLCVTFVEAKLLIQDGGPYKNEYFSKEETPIHLVIDGKTLLKILRIINNGNLRDKSYVSYNYPASKYPEEPRYYFKKPQSLTNSYNKVNSKIHGIAATLKDSNPSVNYNELDYFNSPENSKDLFNNSSPPHYKFHKDFIPQNSFDKPTNFGKPPDSMAMYIKPRLLIPPRTVNKQFGRTWSKKFYSPTGPIRSSNFNNPGSPCNPVDTVGSSQINNNARLGDFNSHFDVTRSSNYNNAVVPVGSTDFNNLYNNSNLKNLVNLITRSGNFNALIGNDRFDLPREFRRPNAVPTGKNNDNNSFDISESSNFNVPLAPTQPSYNNDLVGPIEISDFNNPVGPAVPNDFNKSFGSNDFKNPFEPTGPNNFNNPVPDPNEFSNFNYPVGPPNEFNNFNNPVGPVGPSNFNKPFGPNEFDLFVPLKNENDENYLPPTTAIPDFIEDPDDDGDPKSNHGPENYNYQEVHNGANDFPPDANNSLKDAELDGTIY